MSNLIKYAGGHFARNQVTQFWQPVEDGENWVVKVELSSGSVIPLRFRTEEEAQTAHDTVLVNGLTVDDVVDDF